MRVLLMVLVSFSVLAVEDLQQSFTLNNRQSLRVGVLGPNTGRGQEDRARPEYTIVRMFAAGGTQTLCQLLWTPVGSVNTQSLPLPLSGQPGFQTWQSTQLKPLFAPEVMRVDVISGNAVIEESGGRGCDITYTRLDPLFRGSETVVLMYRDDVSNADLVRVTVTFISPNTPPTIALSASPSFGLEGLEATFTATTADADGHPVTVVYDYGDGTSGSTPSHVYATAGAFTVTATATDGYGGLASAQTVVTVVNAAAHVPTARFTSSDVVAFAGVPFVLDGITSSDPQNALTGYLWDFGDSTPKGTTATITHVYALPGVYSVALTVTDAEGFTNTLTREIEVLSEQEAATFDGEVTTTATYYPLKQNRDVLSVFARVNVGDAQLASGSSVAVEYAGQRFQATLNKRLRAAGWVIKQNLRRQAPGTVEVSLRVRNASFSTALSAIGAADDVVLDVPVKIELGTKTIEVQVPTDFEATATRGKASGQF